MNAKERRDLIAAVATIQKLLNINVGEDSSFEIKPDAVSVIDDDGSFQVHEGTVDEAVGALTGE